MFFNLKYKTKNSEYCLLLENQIYFQKKSLNWVSTKIKRPFRQLVDETVVNKRKTILNDYYILF